MMLFKQLCNEVEPVSQLWDRRYGAIEILSHVALAWYDHSIQVTTIPSVKPDTDMHDYFVSGDFDEDEYPPDDVSVILDMVNSDGSKPIVWKSSQEMMGFLTRLAQVAAHELLHRFQFVTKKHRALIGPYQSQFADKHKRYLSTVYEIEAYAACIATDFALEYGQGCGDYFGDWQWVKLSHVSPFFKEYADLFGITHPVFDRLLLEINANIELIERDNDVRFWTNLRECQRQWRPA